MPILFENFTITNLSADISDSQTSISIDSAADFPVVSANTHGRLVLRSLSTPSKKEAIYYTALSGNTLTIVRGQEGTTAAAFDEGDEVLGWITREFLNDFVIRNNFIHDTSVTDHGDSSIVGSLAREIANIGAANATVEVAGGTYTFAQNYTIPSNIKLFCHHGAKFNAGANTVTVNCLLEATDSELFGTGTFTGDFRGADLKPEWFGAARNGSTDDSGAIIKAIAAAPANGSVVFQRGTYQVAADINFGSGNKPEIIFERGAKLTLTSGTDLTFDGNSFISPKQTSISLSSPSLLNGTIKVSKYFPEWFGGTPDDTTDSREAIKYCVDLADNAGGGCVELTVGKWRMSNQILLGQGTILQGETYAVRTSTTQDGASLRALDSAGTSMLGNKTITGSTKSIQIRNLSILGNFSGGNAVKGIEFGNVKYCVLENLFLENFQLQAIHFSNVSSLVTRVQHVLIINSVLNSGLSGITGAFHISGFDCNITDCEFVPSATSRAESGNRVAMVVDGASNFFNNIQASFGEEGIIVTSAGGGCHFANVRSDKNYGHGWKIQTGGGTFVGCEALNNSTDADNTYDGFHVLASNNMFAGCNARSQSGFQDHRYGFHDGSGNFGNLFRACVSTGHGTAAFSDNGNRKGIFDNNIPGFEALTADDATPDVANKMFMTIPQNTVETEITNFDGDILAPQIVALRASASTFKSWMKHDNDDFRLKQTWYPRIGDTIFFISNTTGSFNEIGRSDRGPAEFLISFNFSEEDNANIGIHGTYPMDDNATIIEASYFVQQPFASATNTATLAIGIETVDPAGILAATQVNNASLAAGWHRAIQRRETTSTYSVKTNAAGQRIQFDVQTENLTSGLLWLYCKYLITS